MTRTTYEIRLAGPMPAGLAPDFADMTRIDTPAETVLVADVADPHDLERLIGRIRDLGLELRELRRSPDCEVRLTGRLGGALLAALPHTSVRSVSSRTVLMVEAERDDLVTLLERIVGSGLEVDSVRDLTLVADPYLPLAEGRRRDPADDPPP